MRILFWFRNDLRLDDNTGLHEAVRDSGGDVVPFALLDADGAAPARERFRLESLAGLAREIGHADARLALAAGPALEAVPRAALAVGATAVYWNDEHEPGLEARDRQVEAALAAAGVRVRRFHDRLLVPPGLVKTRTGGPFLVFGSFRRACEALPIGTPLPRAARFAEHDLPGPEPETIAPAAEEDAHGREAGGARAARARLRRFAEQRLERYAAERDVLAAEANSHLSADLRAGTLSPRTLVAALRERATEARGTPAARAIAASIASFVAELRWRDFFAHVMHHLPRCEHEAFRPGLDRIRWAGEPAHLGPWRDGLTGYPVVDAGMRELAATGFMHNRARMIVASFLVKDLLLDWRSGEAIFLQRLADADLASNNGNWQWTAGTGTDAQPWFRVFNPVLQGERFDRDGRYVRRWVSELEALPSRWIHKPWEAPDEVLREAQVRFGDTYPARLVEHERQRERALAMFRAAAEGAAGPGKGDGAGRGRGRRTDPDPSG